MNKGIVFGLTLPAQPDRHQIMVGITDKAPKKCWVEQLIVNMNEVTAKGGSLSSWYNDWAPSKELKCGLNNLYELYTMKHSSST